MMKRILGLLLAGMVGGCLTTAEDLEPACTDDTEAAAVAGAWRLTAEGDRGQCEDPTMNGTLSLTARDVLPVAAAPATDAPTADLYVEDAAFPAEFTGSVVGRCVRFTITDNADAGTAVYDFEGRAEGLDRIRGRFHGDGPGACAAHGSFEVQIE